MCERVLKVDNPTPKQLKFAGEMIYDSLLEKYGKEIAALGKGKFDVRDFGYSAYVDGNKVLTIKTLDDTEENVLFKGGISKGGTKRKKMKRSCQFDSKGKNISK